MHFCACPSWAFEPNPSLPGRNYNFLYILSREAALSPSAYPFPNRPQLEIRPVPLSLPRWPARSRTGLQDDRPSLQGIQGATNSKNARKRGPGSFDRLEGARAKPKPHSNRVT